VTAKPAPSRRSKRAPKTKSKSRRAA
jgi:hypothetical protein